MKAEDLLYNLKSSGIELRAEGEQLRWRAPRGIMGSDLLDSIKLHKPELLALLKSNKADDYCQDHMNQIIHGDCLKVLEGMPDNSIDLIVTDPPYGINFMGKDWDKEIASVEVWKECYRVLKPGAFAFIISYPRLDVFHLNTMNVKSAGLRIDFSPLFWAHKKGALFHGSMDKAIDKRNGAKRNEIARNPNSRENCNKNSTLYRSGTVGKTAYITKPVTAEAQYFEGSYPGFLPRPIVEPIIVVMKPCEKKNLYRSGFVKR